MTRPGARMPLAQTHATPVDHDRHDAGITLVETIVALALGALVVAFLAQGTGLLRHFVALGRTVSAQDETLAIRDHLRRTVESAMGRTGPTPWPSPAGVGDTAVFTVAGDPLLERGGPVRITLAAVAENRTVSLVETRTPAGRAGQRGRTRRLLTGLAAVQFAYHGASGRAADWLSEWTDPEAGPTLMRIDIAFPPGDARRWPPFIVLMPAGGAAPAPGNPPDKADAGAAAKPG